MRVASFRGGRKACIAERHDLIQCLDRECRERGERPWIAGSFGEALEWRRFG